MSLLECLLCKRHVSSEVHLSATGEMCVDDNVQLDSTLLSPGSTSVSSLNSLPTSPSKAENQFPVFPQNMSPSLVKEAAEPFDEKDDSNQDHLSEDSSTACVSSLTLQEKLSNSHVGDRWLQDCSAMRSSYEEGLLSEENVNDAETTETVQSKDGTGLSEEETQILKSEVAFSQNQCHELRQQIIELKEQLQQYDAEKQQLELELGRKSFLEDKQKRSEKVLLSSRVHISEQGKSCTASGTSYAFTSMEGKWLGGASSLRKPGN